MSRAVLFISISLASLGQLHAVDFSQSIRPILSDYCFRCHGPDEQERATEMRLDTKEGVDFAFQGGDFDKSEAWRRILSTDPDEQMPPPEFHKSLSTEQISLLKQWMESGTSWSQHWAFVSPSGIEPPKVEGVENPLDRFVAERLKREGLELSPRASRETLIRRLKFDLLGLPPTVTETAEFVSDSSPHACEQLVDRLLDSPHFGEHMATEWLDGARYADTNGYQNDFKRSMWPWRDWVISAFNANMPYDQFVIEQLAGDMLPNPTLEQRIATAFNRNHRTVTEGGSIDQEWLVENVIDRVETTSTVFLGLTMGCARCHDHKYDPISQREFYEFFSFFHNVKEKGVYLETRGNVAPLQPVLPPEDLARLSDLRKQRSELESTEKRLRQEVPNLAKRWDPIDDAAGDEKHVPESTFRINFAGDAIATSADGTSNPPETETGSFDWPETIFGKCVSLSGLHELSYGQAISPKSSDAFSFTFWVKPEKMGSIVDKINLDSKSRGFDIFWREDGRLEMHLIHSWPNDALKVSTQEMQSVPKGQWSHVAISHDGSKKVAGCTIRVNGREVALKADQDQLKGSIAVETPIRIGVKSRDRLFSGQLFDLRYFDQTLSQDESVAIARERLTTIKTAKGAELMEALQKDREALFVSYSQSKLATQVRETKSQIQQLKKELAELEAAQTVMVMEELAEPRKTYVLNRGEYDKPDKSQPVSAEIPRFLGTLPEGVKKDRLALAKWIVADDNPLTARVRVNRIWQMLFGTGLVKSSENFGVQADAPSHPELLDWLATEFVRLEWDTKALLKLIVTSETYRQSSHITAELLAKDPANRLLSRGARFRLSAESIRDNALAVSGLLSKKLGGPSVKPYQPAKLWDELAGGAGEGPYVQSEGEDLYRRSLYIYRKRTVPHPATSTFDAPSFEICQVARARTNTPLQALALMNDVTYVEAARKLAERMLLEGGEEQSEQLTYGFQLATGRQPSRKELDTLENSYHRKLKIFDSDPQAAEEFLKHGESSRTDAFPPAQFAAYSAVASVLLNLDETITKE